MARGRPKAVDGGKTVALYLDAKVDGWIDRMTAVTGGNRSLAAALAMNTHRAVTEAYEPPLDREERRRVLNALNGVAMHQTPPEAWRGALLGNLLADDEDAPTGDLVAKLRALPRWELVLLVQWAMMAWAAVGRGEDVGRFLGEAA